MIGRRGALLGGASLAFAGRVRSSLARAPARIGWLKIQKHGHAPEQLQAFRDGLKEFGQFDGSTYVLDERYADDEPARLVDLARDLVNAGVDIILASSQPCVDAARKATQSVPIVGRMTDDPVSSGAAASLAQPKGNVTGIYTLLEEMSSKRLTFLRDAVPGIRRVGLLLDPARGATTRWVARTEAVAQELGMQLERLVVGTGSDVPAAFAQAEQRAVQGIIAFRNPALVTHAPEIIQRATALRLPTIFDSRDFVEAGALMSYGPNIEAILRRLAHHVVRILAGAAPGNLPIEQPTRFELVINQTTARKIGLALPDSLLALADRVVE